MGLVWKMGVDLRSCVNLVGCVNLCESPRPTAPLERELGERKTCGTVIIFLEVPNHGDVVEGL